MGTVQVLRWAKGGPRGVDTYVFFIEEKNLESGDGNCLLEGIFYKMACIFLAIGLSSLIVGGIMGRVEVLVRIESFWLYWLRLASCNLNVTKNERGRVGVDLSGGQSP